MQQFGQDQFRQLLNNQKQEAQQQPKIYQNQNPYKRKSRVDLKDMKYKKKHIDQSERIEIPKDESIFPLISLNENPVILVKQSEMFRFGNYKRYYNLRYERRWNDPRLSVLTKEYFYQKRVLDIGCNDGTVTLILAMRYFPTKIQGIDIDFQLVNKAIDNMTSLEQAYKKMYTTNHIEQHTEQEEVNKSTDPPQQTNTQDIMNRLAKLPKCFLMNIEDKACENLDKLYVLENLQTIVDQDIETKDLVNTFPNNVYFRIENFISNVTRINERYDTILCLSTTKWIHLNWGDDGIKRLFKKVYDSLYMGGYFILEPQDWKSYKKKRYFCDDFKKVYKQIKTKPEMFKDILMVQYNFKLIKEIKPDDIEAISKGKSAFKRVIYIFQKSM